MANEPKNYAAWHDGSPRGAMQSLDAKQTTGAGTAFVLPKAFSAFGVQAKRATTSATNESTSGTIVLQGSLDGANYVTLSGNVVANSTAAVLARSTSSIPVTYVRLRVSSFTTSAGAATTAENKIPISAWIAAGQGSS